MRLSIVIVSWNVREYLLDCLRSILANPLRDEWEVFVVDNASKDGTVDAVRREFPGVHLIVNAENRGFAAANNQVLEGSVGEYALLLNPDTIVHPGALDVLVRFMDENPDVGACGPKLLNGDGTIQHSIRGFPTFRGALHHYRPIKSLPLFRNAYDAWVMTRFGYDRRADVDQPMGAALLIRRSVLRQVGCLDERFFMYYEEVDLCYRIKQAGWRIIFVPEATVTHWGGRSAEGIPVERRVMGFTSLLHYFRKHRGRRVGRIYACVLTPMFLLKQVRNLAISPLTYFFATLERNERKRDKAAVKIRTSALLLLRHSWRLLFKT